MFPGRDPHGVALMKTENASVISNHALKFYFLKQFKYGFCQACFILVIAGSILTWLVLMTIYHLPLLPVHCAQQCHSP